MLSGTIPELKAREYNIYTTQEHESDLTCVEPLLDPTKLHDDTEL